MGSVVCAADYDITLRSSDGILFKVHRRNLEVHSEVFAGADAISPDGSSGDEAVSLSETSTVLDLLLQHMYRGPQLDLRKIDFKSLAGLAEAAEKYQVFGASNICQMYMRYV